MATNTSRSGTLVIVLVTLLTGKRMSLGTSLGLSVEQEMVLVCLPWAKKLAHLSGFHGAGCWLLVRRDAGDVVPLKIFE